MKGIIIEHGSPRYRMFYTVPRKDGSTTFVGDFAFWGQVVTAIGECRLFDGDVVTVIYL